MPLIDDFGTLVDETGKAIPASKGMLNRAGSAIISKLPSSSAALKGLGKLAIYGAPVAGAFQTMGASPEQITGYAEGLGANPATRGGRILGNTAMFVDETLMGAPSRIAAAGREAITDPALSRAEQYDPAHALYRFGRNLFGRLGQDVADWWNEPATGPGMPTSASGVTASGSSNVPIDAGDFARGESAAAARTGGGVARLAAPVMPADTTSLIPGTTVKRTIQNLPGGFDLGTITDGRYTPGPAYGGGQVEIQRGGLSPQQEILDMVAAANRNQDVQTASLLREARIGSHTSREAAAKEAEILSKAAGQPTGTDLMARVLQSQEAGNAAETTANIQAKSALEQERLQQAGATSRHDFAGARVKQLTANAIMKWLDPSTPAAERTLLAPLVGVKSGDEAKKFSSVDVENTLANSGLAPDKQRRIRLEWAKGIRTPEQQLAIMRQIAGE